MNISKNSFDTLEQLIQEAEIRIKEIDVHPDLDILLIKLNTGKVLQEKLSIYPRLHCAPLESLKKYRLIGKGLGVHWAELDEDLSLKGFLRNALKKQIGSVDVSDSNLKMA
jgi:Protein of unknown function (DUF2442)